MASQSHTRSRGDPGATIREIFVGSTGIAGEKARDRAASLFTLLGITVLLVRRWFLIGPYPPGLDGAQWLALGRGFHGVGRSTDGAYAPLTPLLATMAEALLGPLPALRLLALGSGLAVALAIWLLAKNALGPRWGLLTAGVAIPASALAEPLMYGGYPQQFALAAGIVSLWATCRYLLDGDARFLWIMGFSAVLCAEAHHIYFPLILLSVLMVALLWCSTPEANARWQVVRPLALAMAPACAVLAVVAYQFASSGYQAPLQGSERTLWDGWRYATREAPLVWLALLIAAFASLALLWRNRASLAWLSAAGLILPAGCLFVLSGQPRLLPPVLIGTCLAVGLGAKNLLPRHGQIRPLPLLFVVAVAMTLLLAADRATAGFAEFYRVVDQPLIEAAAAIARDRGSGAVAVREDRRGWPLGWWFEALLTQTVIVGSDPRWLGFPSEQEHARQAAALFDGGLDPPTFAALAAANDIGYLVIPKWDWIGWERWLRQPEFPVTVLHDDDRYLVLRVTTVTQDTENRGV